MQKLLSSEEVCQLLNVEYRTLMKYLKAGLPSYKPAGKRYYKENEVLKWIEEKKEG